MCGIYLIRNTITNKVYIGQSNNIERRWSEHKARAFNLNNNCAHKPLYLSMRKYGIDVFIIEVLCECLPSELDEKEVYYINKYNSIVPNGYNILPGGKQVRRPSASINLGVKRHQVKNGKLVLCSCCNKPMTNKSLTGLCRSCYCKTTRKVNRPSKEQLIIELKSVDGNFEAVGRKYGITGNSIRKWCKNYDIPFHSKDYKQIKLQKKQPFKIAVNQIDKNTNEIIATYESANAAARALGKEKGNHITEVCKGTHATAYGYKWEYASLV